MVGSVWVSHGLIAWCCCVLMPLCLWVLWLVTHVVGKVKGTSMHVWMPSGLLVSLCGMVPCVVVVCPCVVVVPCVLWMVPCDVVAWFLGVDGVLLWCLDVLGWLSGMSGGLMIDMMVWWVECIHDCVYSCGKWSDRGSKCMECRMVQIRDVFPSCPICL